MSVESFDPLEISNPATVPDSEVCSQGIVSLLDNSVSLNQTEVFPELFGRRQAAVADAPVVDNERC